MGNRILSRILLVAMLAGMFNGMFVSKASAAIDASLLLWYKFSEGSGAVVADSSGNGHGGTLNGTYNWTNGPDGSGAISLDGSSGFVQMPNSILSGLTSMTVATNVYIDNVNANPSWIFTFGSSTNPNSDANAHYLGFLLGSANYRTMLTTTRWVNEQSTSVSSPFPKGVWKHVAYTQTGTIGTLYVDGVQVAQNSNVAYTPAQMESTIANYIGKPAYTVDKYFKGRISDFRLYNRALNASEVQGLASGGDMVSVAQDKAALSLGDTSGLISNLTLPSTGTYGSTLTWSSSDASVITNTGVISPGSVDKTATLTATITKGAASDTKTFNVLVKNNTTAANQLLVDEAAKIVIPDANAVRGNITLPTTGSSGVTIAWTSDRPDVINTYEVTNANYDKTPPGVVTRPTTDTSVNLTASLYYNGQSYQKIIPVIVKAKPKALTSADMKDYLFAYFTGESSTGEQTYFATSKDGLNWQDLNDLNPVLTSDVGTKGVRDQYIFRSAEGDKFYILATDLRIASGAGWGAASTAGSKNLVIWESTDLVNWSSPRLINIGLPNSGFTWAPEAIYDDKTGEYILYWASNPTNASGTFDTPNVYYVKTRDFHTFTQPTLYIHRMGTKGIIDADILKTDSTYNYHRVSVSDGQILIEGSNQLLHTTWDVIGTLQSVGKTNSDVEAPQIIKFNDRNEYAIIADQYATGKGYLPVLTNDLSAPSTYHIPDSSQYWFGVNLKRHGEVMSVTQDEYDAVMAKWGDVPNKPIEQPQQNPILAYNFDESSTNGTIKDISGNNYAGTLNGNAKYVTDSEKNSQVLYLDGTNGTFAALPKGFFDGRDTVSISMDMKPVTVSGSFFTFGIGKSTTKYMFLKTTDTQIRNAITMGSYWSEEEAKQATGSIANKWINIKLVLTPTTMTIYKDNKLFAQNNNVHVPMSYLGKDLLSYLGKSFYAGDAYFKGYFDNVKVYNRALTPAEIGDNGSSVTAVSLNKSLAHLEVGQTDTLIATITPDSAANKGVTFTSSNGSVVVSSSMYDPQKGTTSVTITGASEGSSIITATTADGAKMAVSTVYVGGSHTDGLKLWYKFDETSGTAAVDSSGNGYSGTYVNTPVWGTGMGNGSFKMSGGNSSPYVKIPGGLLKGTNSMTISTFVKWDKITSGNPWQWLYALGVNSNKYIFMTPFNGSSTLYAAITNYTGTNSNSGYTTEQRFPGTESLPGNAWKHVALVLDSDHHTGTMYVDGLPVATNTNVTVKPSDLYDASMDYSGYIGKSFYPGDPYFSGEVDDFRIYDRALSGAEVADLAGPLMITTSILKVTLPELKFNASIDKVNSKITLALKPGSNIKSIAPVFDLPSGTTISPASGSSQDFTNPVTYTVTGMDGSTQQWTIKAVIANNPVLPGLYADPEAAVFGNKYYIYPTTDGYPGWSSTYFKAFSSEDLIHWKDEGTIFDLQKDENWDGVNKYAWAPAIAEKNGIYYFYYSASSNIGVATSNSPAGPFKDALGKALIAKGSYSGQMIDPTVFKDDDGQYYIYFGQYPGYVAKLNDDMISLAGPAKPLTISGDSYHEGGYVFKRNGIYYLMWSKNDTGSEDYQVVYATSTSPTGPFTSKGIILQKDLSLGIKGTGHNSVIKIPGKDEYYIVYHRLAIPDGDGNHREVNIDKLEFNTDGSIKPVVPTLEGISVPVYLSSDLSQVSLAASTNVLKPGYTVTTGLTAALSDGHQADLSNAAVTYISSDETVAVVDGHGVVTAVKEGTAQVKAVVSWNGKSVESNAVMITVDGTPPVTTAVVNPTAPDGADGWFVHDATISLQATDALTGGVQTLYSLDGGVVWMTYTGTIQIQNDGKNTINYKSFDKAGNEEASHTLVVSMDQTAPLITLLTTPSYSDSASWTPQVSVSDDVSGVDISKIVISLDGQIVQKDQSIALYKLPLGAHTITVTASDMAGNTVSTTAVFQTATSIDALQTLIARFADDNAIDNKGIAESLKAKLGGNNLKSFISEVQAQNSKHISQEASSILLRDAQALSVK